MDQTKMLMETATCLLRLSQQLKSVIPCDDITDDKEPRQGESTSLEPSINIDPFLMACDQAEKLFGKSPKNQVFSNKLNECFKIPER